MDEASCDDTEHQRDPTLHLCTLRTLSLNPLLRSPSSPVGPFSSLPRELVPVLPVLDAVLQRREDLSVLLQGSGDLVAVADGTDSGGRSCNTRRKEQGRGTDGIGEGG